MLINVTQEDIQRGAPYVLGFCPTAIATNRSFHSQDCVVGRSWLSVGDAYYDLPDEAIEFIRKFDEGLEVVPLSFEVSEQPEYRRRWNNGIKSRLQVEDLTARDFWDYEDVRVSGVFNMLTNWQQAATAAGLSEEVYTAVMQNYEELARKYK